MKQISAAELRARDAGDYLLIDIREAWERELYNIGGLHLPMDELFKKATELPRDKEVILYCEKGIRSVIAIQRLEAQGFSNLTNLAGGMKAWKAGNL